MSEDNGAENKKTKKGIGTSVLLTIAFILIGYLLFENYSLKQRMEYYANISDEFHQNIYARVDATGSDGSHMLSISDVYYKRYFDNKKE